MSAYGAEWGVTIVLLYYFVAVVSIILIFQLYLISKFLAMAHEPLFPYMVKVGNLGLFEVLAHTAYEAIDRIYNIYCFHVEDRRYYKAWRKS